METWSIEVIYRPEYMIILHKNWEDAQALLIKEIHAKTLANIISHPMK